MCHLFLLQGKHPHYLQSNTVVTQVCYNPTKLGNLPVDAENTVVSKLDTMSCCWELRGVSRTCNGFAFSHLLIRTCHWAVAFVQLSLWKLFKIFEKLWKDASGCLHRRRCSTLAHTHLVSQVPSTLGETTLHNNIHYWYCVGGVWGEQ